MLAELKRLKQEFPDRVLIASIMEEYNKAPWEEIIARCERGGHDCDSVSVCSRCV